jgi:hypothetical protein
LTPSSGQTKSSIGSSHISLESVLHKLSFDIKIFRLPVDPKKTNFFVTSYAQHLILKMLLYSTKLQFVMRISKTNYVEVKVHTPFLNCWIIKLCSHEKNKILKSIFTKISFLLSQRKGQIISSEVNFYYINIYLKNAFNKLMIQL